MIILNKKLVKSKNMINDLEGQLGAMLIEQKEVLNKALKKDGEVATGKYEVSEEQEINGSTFILSLKKE